MKKTAILFSTALVLTACSDSGEETETVTETVTEDVTTEETTEEETTEETEPETEEETTEESEPTDEAHGGDLVIHVNQASHVKTYRIGGGMMDVSLTRTEDDPGSPFAGPLEYTDLPVSEMDADTIYQTTESLVESGGMDCAEGDLIIIEQNGETVEMNNCFDTEQYQYAHNLAQVAADANPAASPEYLTANVVFDDPNSQTEISLGQDGRVDDARVGNWDLAPLDYTSAQFAISSMVAADGEAELCDTATGGEVSIINNMGEEVYAGGFGMCEVENPQNQGFMELHRILMTN